jgi:hypothetical protein
MIIPGVLVGFGATGLIMRYLTPDPDLRHPLVSRASQRHGPEVLLAEDAGFRDHHRVWRQRGP